MTDSKVELYQELKELGEQMANMVKSQDLTKSFKNELPEKLNFNSEHIRAMRIASTFTLHQYAFKSFDAKASKEERQAHISLKLLYKAFVDPIIKTSQNISGGATIERDDLILKNLDDARKCISDILFNYSKILFAGMPKTISRAITEYGDLSFKIDAAFDKLNEFQDTPYKADPKKHHNAGKDALNRVTENFVLLQELGDDLEIQIEPKDDPRVSPELHQQLLDIANEVQAKTEQIDVIDLEYRHNQRYYLELAQQQRMQGIEITVEPPEGGPILFETLISSFEQKEFSHLQIQTIEEKMEKPLSHKITRDGFPYALAHSCLDPYIKALNGFTEQLNMKSYDVLRRDLDDGVKCLDDIISNSEILLGNDTPILVKRLIEGYEEIASKMEKAAELIDEAFGEEYKPDPNKKHTEGKDCLNALPDDFATLGLKSPEPGL